MLESKFSDLASSHQDMSTFQKYKEETAQICKVKKSWCYLFEYKIYVVG